MLQVCRQHHTGRMAENKAAIRTALKQAARVCQTSLAVLPQPVSSSASTSDTVITPIHPTLPPIFVDLLQTIKSHITSASLSFSPPITPDGALTYLAKAQDAIARLTSCVVAAAGDDMQSARESVLVEDWASAARGVTESVQALISAYADHLEISQNWEKATKSGEKTLPDVGKATAPYLTHTATVWDVIDKSLQNVTGTEAQAAQRRWTIDADAMTDAWAEYEEMLEDAEGEDELDEGGNDGDDDDDEWAGLEKDLMGGGKLNAEELARVQKAKPLLQLTRLVHRSVLKALPSHHRSFRPLLADSATLSAVYDTSISSLYSPQSVDDLMDAFADLVRAARAVAMRFKKEDGLVEGMSRLQVGQENETADWRKVQDLLKKWEPKLDEEVVKWES